MNMFTVNSNIHSYNTRSSNRFHRWNYSNNKSKYSLRHTGPALWNDLDLQNFNIQFNNTFKRKYKNVIINTYWFVLQLNHYIILYDIHVIVGLSAFFYMYISNISINISKIPFIIFKQLHWSKINMISGVCIYTSLLYWLLQHTPFSTHSAWNHYLAFTIYI